ncbi:MAG: hypothetical protein EBU90_13015 [Proteobacteria bacterium]|nr:hypothetical protein [Pseudomonadota bacterium]NBP15483.1 hypothetical protein [bacterium]
MYTYASKADRALTGDYATRAGFSDEAGYVFEAERSVGGILTTGSYAFTASITKNVSGAYLIGFANSTAYAETGGVCNIFPSRSQYAGVAGQVSNVGYANRINTSTRSPYSSAVNSSQNLEYTRRAGYGSNFSGSFYTTRSTYAEKASLAGDVWLAEYSNTCQLQPNSDRPIGRIGKAQTVKESELIGYATNISEASYASKAGTILSNTGVNIVDQISYAGKTWYVSGVRQAQIVFRAGFSNQATRSNMADKSNFANIVSNVNVSLSGISGLNSRSSNSAGYSTVCQNFGYTSKSDYSLNTLIALKAGTGIAPYANYASQVNSANYASQARSISYTTLAGKSNIASYASISTTSNTAASVGYSTMAGLAINARNVGSVNYASIAELSQNVESGEIAGISNFSASTNYSTLASGLVNSGLLIFNQANYATIGGYATSVNYANQVGFANNISSTQTAGSAVLASNSIRTSGAAYANIAGAVYNKDTFVPVVAFSDTSKYASSSNVAGSTKFAARARTNVKSTEYAITGGSVESEWSLSGPNMPMRVSGTNSFAKTVALCLKYNTRISGVPYREQYQVWKFTNGILVNIYPPSDSPWYTGSNINSSEYKTAWYDRIFPYASDQYFDANLFNSYPPYSIYYGTGQSQYREFWPPY